MASSEGVAYRWEAFNRWCDEYADRHQGMKPKVEDVRRWHRENAENVWPDSNERPSVFLAVSHNKGRRVRGHKTCEYYKRYRAGKAAEQQLAGRLQPAALSGRRILAVTAAARRLNTDGGSGRGGGVVKRLSPNNSALDDRDLQDLEHQPEKRPRLRNHPRPHHHQHTGGGGHHHHHHHERGRGRGRGRSSSEGLSDDPSWASSADVSEEDDSGSGGAEPLGLRPPEGHPGLRAHRNGVHGGLLQPPQSLPGVHITTAVVHRDADGRTTRQLQQQQQPQQQTLRQATYALQQGVYVAAAGEAAAGSVAPALACRVGAEGGRGWGVGSGGGNGSGGRGGACREAYGYGRPVRLHGEGMTDGGEDEEQDGADNADMGASPPQRRGRGSTREMRRCSPDHDPGHDHDHGNCNQQRREKNADGGEEEEDEDDDDDEQGEGLVGLQGAERKPCCSQEPYGSCGWRWGPHGHPGVAPRECRAARSSDHHASEQHQQPRLAPHFSGYVGTPVGSMPVFHIAARSRTGGGGPAAMAAAAARRGGGGRRLAAAAPSSEQRRLGCGVDLTSSDGAAKDPLDLLAQAACEALASPRPVYGEPGAAADGDGDADAKAQEQDQGPQQRAAGRGGGYQSGPRDGLGWDSVGRRVPAGCSGGGAQSGLPSAAAEQKQQQPQQQRVEVKAEVEAEWVGPPRVVQPTERSERCCNGAAGLAPEQGDITGVAGVKPELPSAAAPAASECFSDATCLMTDACTAAPAPAWAAVAQPHTRVGAASQQQLLSDATHAMAAKLMPPSPDSCAKVAHSSADAGADWAAAALAEDGGGRAPDGEAVMADGLTVRAAEVQAEAEAEAIRSSAAAAQNLDRRRDTCRRVFPPADEVALAAVAAAHNASGGDGLTAPNGNVDLDLDVAQVAAVNVAAANIAGAAVAAVLLQQQQQQQQQQARTALDAGVGCCPALLSGSVGMGSVLAAIAATAGGDTHGPGSPLPPVLPPALWTALAGRGVAGASTGLGTGQGLGAGAGADTLAQPPVAVLAAAAAAAAATTADGFFGTGSAPGPVPLLSEGLPSSLDYTIGGQLLPVVRLLQMQMAAGLQDSLAAGGSNAGTATALQAAQAAGCLVPPSLDLGALVGASAAAAPHSMQALTRALQQS